MAKKKISLVIPFYNEVEQIPLTLATVTPILRGIENLVYEIVAVDDGSTDGSWEILTEMLQQYSSLVCLRLSRNFGKEAAISAGLERVSGDAAILMDGDLQHDPKHIPEMVALWLEGYEVVEGIKSSRGKESVFSRMSANSFYGLFRRVSGIDLKNASDYKLLDRKVIDAWNSLPEKDSFFRALSAWLGYKRTTFAFVVAERTTGKSKWGFFKLLKLSISALTGFSSKPLVLINILGSVLLLFFLVMGIHTLVNYAQGNAVAGFTTVILLQLFIGGAVLLSLGLIGTYVNRIFSEVKGRPRFLVSEEKASAQQANSPENDA